MVVTGYCYLQADVTKLTASAVLLAMMDGPRKGENVWVPLSLFDEPDFVEQGDDEVVVARWFVEREGLQ